VRSRDHRDADTKIQHQIVETSREHENIEHISLCFHEDYATVEIFCKENIMKSIKDKTMYVLSAGVIVALILAIVGDYIISGLETSVTGDAQEVSADVMKLAQTALGGVIGVLGGYFGAKAGKEKEGKEKAGKENEQGPEQAALVGKIVHVLAIGTMAAVCLAIVGDYITAALETTITRQPQDVSSAVMTLVQTALGGVIGLIGAYFGANE